MALCKDTLVTYLDKVGYNVVRLPRTGINPLDIIVKDNNSKEYNIPGSVNEIWTTAQDAPKPDNDNKAANIQRKETSLLNVSVGISALGDIFSGMGFSVPKLDLAFSKTKKLKIAFNNVSIEKITPFKIGSYLRSGDVNKLDEGNIMVKYFLDNELPLYIISETLKSNSISIESYRDEKTSAEIDLGILKDAIKANPKISTEKETESAITYTGQDNLVFGFKCYELSYSDQGWGIEGLGNTVFLDDTQLPSPSRLSENLRVSIK